MALETIKMKIISIKDGNVEEAADAQTLALTHLVVLGTSIYIYWSQFLKKQQKPL